MSVSSCSDASKQNKPGEKHQFKTKDEAIKNIYNNFLYEKNVCQNFVVAIAEDKEFIEAFENLDYRERKSGKRVFKMLAQSKVAKNEVIQYIQRHTDYFIIDQAFEACPGEIYVKDSGIFCTQTDKRLKEIENLGPSDQSWKVREYYLNISLDNLLKIGMPWSEGGGVSYDFKTLSAEVDTTKKLYSGQFKEPLKKWIQKTSMQLKKEMANGENYYTALIKGKGQNTTYYLTSKENGLREVNSWIAELNKGLE